LELRQKVVKVVKELKVKSFCYFDKCHIKRSKYGKIRIWGKKEITQWGLPLEEIKDLGKRLEEFYKRFSAKFRTQTRNTSEYGLKYISGLLRMETDRNLANVGRKTGVSGQNLQHFVSNSTWSGEEVILAVESEVRVHPAFQEAILVWDL